MKVNFLRKALSLLVMLVMLVPLASPAFATGETEESVEPSDEPTITAGDEIIAFDALPDNIRWQNTTRPEFPETVSGAVYGKPTEIPVTWQADHTYNAASPARGLYVFDAVLGEGFTLAEDVEVPRITVYIPETGISLFRMGGSGTSESPLEITTAAQLAEIAVLVNAGRLETFLLNDANATVSLKLMNDLDLSAYGQSYNGGKGWMPIGFYNVTSAIPFKGSFDGNGHMISGLYINDSTRNFAGLFGITKSAAIKNLSLSAVNIRAYNCVGGIAGMAYGTGSITNCRVSGSVNGNSNLGGLIGTTETIEATDYSMSRCSFEGTVNGSGVYIGGLIGTVKNCAVSYSYAAAAVSGNERVGGLVGDFKCLPAIGALQYCYAIGSVEGAKYVGGLVGYANYGDVQNCAALNSAVEASTSGGGRVAGVNWNATLSGNAAFNGMTVKVNASAKSAQDDAAGVDGADMTAAGIKADGSIATRFTDADGWTIENGKLPGFGSAVDMPEYITDVTDPNFLGAGTAGEPYLIGTAAQLAKLAELVNAGTSTYAAAGVYYKLANDINLSSYGSGWNGGKGWVSIGCESGFPFKGNFDGAGNIISGLYIKGSDLENFMFYAGLFGVIDDNSAVVENLGIIGASVSAFKYIGGVAGYVDGGTVQNCYTTGSFSGENEVGGVVGHVDGGMVQNCYTTSSVSGNQWVGGVAGYVEGGTVQYCYATGSVSGWLLVGGVAGYVEGGTVQNCFALNPIVSATNSAGRVVGNNDGGTLADNYAFSGMTGGGNDKIENGLDGADVTADILQKLGGLLTAAPWTYQYGTLPGLFGKTVEMPAHITAKLTNSFAGGTGEQSDPYQISTAAQLAKLAELVNAGNINYNDKYYKLTADIDLSVYGASNTTFNGGKGWIPIGNNTGTTFKGSFDGNYKTISGLYINNSLYYTGLFGLADGPISNLGLTSVNITSTNTGGTGGIAGITQASGIVSGCFVAGEVSGFANVGGVVGTARCSIANCYATGSVKGTGNNIGGIAGECAALSNCYAANAVSGSGMVGGIAGMTGGELKNCAALNPSVAPNNSYVRRVVGSNTGAGTVKNNYAFSGMKGGGNNKTLNHFDGADFSIAQANTAAFWTTAGNWLGGAWSGTVWTFADDKLPILSGFASGLQSGDGGLYLTERDIANATVSAGGPYIYTGSVIEPSLSVTFDGATLTKGTDYTVAVTSSDNAEGTTSAGANPGEVTVKLIGIGSFKGEKTGVTYTIRSSEVDKDKSTVTADPTSVYIGGIDKSTVTITLKKANGDSLGSGMTITLSQGPGKSIITPVNSGVTDSTGKATFTVTNMTAEAVTYTAAADGITLNQTAAVQFTQEECDFSGDGSQNTPYQISTAAQLAKLAAQVNAGNANFNGKCYILMDDIDLSGYGESYTNLNGDKGWVPIGNYDQKFTGVFDGNGHTVSGLYVNVTTACSDNRKHAGLFGYLGTGGTVKNLGVSGSVKATWPGGTSNLAGGIAGYSEGGIISNCYSTCDVTATGNSYNISGGIVGYNYNGGIIANCYATGNISAITSNEYKGGLAGIINSATITYSYWNTDAIAGGVTQGTLGAGCEGKTLASMKTQAFADALNDCPGFPSDWMKWTYSSSVNGGLPYIVKKEAEPDTVISIAAIGGVTAPARGGTPITSITETAQYTGTVTWLPYNNPFAASTTYTAMITLTPKTGFTLTGVTANFFTVAGATLVTNSANFGIITAEFPATEAEPDTAINIAAIGGVTVPVRGGTPVTSITETAQYTGTVTWLPNNNPFAASTSYTATINLTPKTGFTLTGVVANFFTVAGATSVSNSANSGVITAVFPATEAEPDTAINIAAIGGVTVPVRGGTPVTSITETVQYTGAVTWSPINNPFAASTAYTATITLTPKAGYTLNGVTEDFFTVAGASATNAANTGVITAVFPATEVEPDTVINIAAIGGVTTPVRGGTPVTSITETAQYIGTVTWAPNNNPFAASTSYTATITLTPKTGFTLTGVAANFFTVAGATSVSNDINLGVITAVFPATEAEPDTAITIAAIGGVTAPVRGGTPVTSITETAQYIGVISWSPTHSPFGASTIYTATITLTPKAGYTLNGITENFFTVAGVTATNAANTGIITAVFPATEAEPDTVVDIAAITGVTAPARGALPITTINETAQYTGTITWNPADSLFAASTTYTATITLTPKAGYTLNGVTEDFFTVMGATATNDANTGVITAVFPATEAEPDTVVDIVAITGVTAPVRGAVPVTAITETAQYTGVITWSPVHSPFGASTVYTATITLTPKAGYTLNDVAANFFTVAGATATNAANTGVITAAFPATEAEPDTAVDIAAIAGVTAPVRGAVPVTAITETVQYTGVITWNPAHSPFGASTIYTATITLMPKTGYTLAGVGANFFTVAGATATNAANTGVITAAFPATEAEPDTVVNITAIAGVTVPARGAVPVTAITETAQYTGVITWNPTDNPFAASTAYTATITLAPKTGYTLNGVTENFFTVAGATATNTANTGVITAVFPATEAEPDTVVDIAAIAGVTAPARGAIPVTAITETAQYTGVITWSPAHNPFGASTVYTATITLTPKAGYTLNGVAANFFTVAGATVTNAANIGVITAAFPATEAEPDTAVGIAAIAGVTAPVRGAVPVTTITETTQYTGVITWSPAHSLFGASTVYTATITLTPKVGYTLNGVTEDFFTVAGATATNLAGSGVVTAVFPATEAEPDTAVGIAAIAGVTAPVRGAVPVTTITETTQYTGVITWSPAHSLFGASTVYTATITLTPKVGYTLNGVTEDFFTVAGATATNPAGSGVVTAVFPAMAALTGATISPITTVFDLDNPSDIVTFITWNDANTVTGVVYGSDVLELPADFTVVGNALTITEEFLSGLNLSDGDTVVLALSFNVGNATLTIEVEQSYIPGTDASLSDLTVGGSSVSGFAADTYSYNVQLPYGTQPGNATAIVNATASDSKAAVNITQAATLPGSATVEVTAEDGTEQTYTINFTLGAAPNTAPVRKVAVPATATASVTVNTAYTLNLATIFEDADTGDTLTYKVSVNGADPLVTVTSYVYTPTAVGDTTLVFKANDGTVDSTDTYTVTLTANAAPPVNTAPVRKAAVAATATASVTVNTAYTLNLATIFEDANADILTYKVSVNGAADTGANASYSYTPASTGTTTLVFKANDGTVDSTDTYTVTLTANAASNGGGGGGGGSSTPTTPPAETPQTEITITGNTATATTTTTATVDDNGKASAAVTQEQVSDAISQALAETQKQGNDTAVVVEIKVEAPADAKTVETSIPKEAMELAADGKADALTVSTPIASISFDADALSAISGEAAEDVKITASKVEASTLSAEAQQAVGDRPVFNFSVTSGDKTISEFGGSVSVAIPYTPKAGEDTDSIVIYYINAEGDPEIVSNCIYDPATGTVSFKTNHFSLYAIGYNKVSFNDVSANAWYSKAVGFIAARGITTGTGKGNYSPDAKLTRGEFLVMMMRAYGIAPDTDLTNNFADAGNTYYTGYLAAAKRLGISGGIGNNMFAPGKEITRQEMFTLLYNALKVIGELPEGNTGKPLSEFSDSEQIASWAKDAMKLMTETGTISGSGGKLSPTSTTTRAEMAQVLYNLLSK